MSVIKLIVAGTLLGFGGFMGVLAGLGLVDLYVGLFERIKLARLQKQIERIRKLDKEAKGEKQNERP